MSEELSIAIDTPAASIEEVVIDAPKEEDVSETKAEDPPKAEKTPEQREIDRLRRGIDRRARQLSDARAQLSLTQGQNRSDNQATADDSEHLSLTRAQIKEMITAEAARLAPTLREEAAETERRTSVVQTLATTWGQEKFDELSSELDEAFGGLTDRSGKAKPAIEAIFEADKPARVIEWLTDPDNADEAERISKLGAVQAGKAIERLETKLAAMPANKKPSNVSSAPKPLESIRGGGAAMTEPDESKMTDSQWHAFNEARKRNQR